MNNIKYILVNDGAAEPRVNGPLAQFKVQGSRFKVRAALNCGEVALNFEL